MSKESQLSLPGNVREAELTLVPSARPVQDMIEAILKSGVNSDNVAAAEKLMDLYERMQNKDAERQFNAAFVLLQNDLPVIVAKTIIQNRGKYERFEDVMHVVSPLLVKHGFSVSFAMEAKENRITQTCHLRHISGHSQSNPFTVRSGKGDSDTQADCKAATTAKRNALLNCLNIVIRQDVMQDEEGNALLEGEVISFDKIQYLKEQVKETGSNEANFLKLAGVESYDQITTGKYSVLVNALAMKAKK